MSSQLWGLQHSVPNILHSLRSQGQYALRRKQNIWLTIKFLFLFLCTPYPAFKYFIRTFCMSLSFKLVEPLNWYNLRSQVFFLEFPPLYKCWPNSLNFWNRLLFARTGEDVFKFNYSQCLLGQNMPGIWSR